MQFSKSGHRLNFLITAGGTREYIDPVRFISNASSGKMGYELARAATSAGHRVTLVTGPSSLAVPVGVGVAKVETSAEMFAAVRENFGSCDCLIMAAAVSDYTPVRKSEAKIKKSKKDLVIRLKPTIDILDWAGKSKKKNQVVVGFALEDRDIKTGAELKMLDKNLDMIIANTPAAIGSDRSKVWVKKAGEKWRSFPEMSKKRVAGRLIMLIEQLALAG